jgi:hypothetical protein
MSIYKNKFDQGLTFLGGFGNDPDENLTKNQYDALSESEREQFDINRLSAKNKGIGELFLSLSDVFAGRDVAGRAAARAQNRLKQEQIDRAERKRQQINNIFKENQYKDFETPEEYYLKVGESLINAGDVAQGVKFLNVARPKTQTEQQDAIIKANTQENKAYQVAQKGVVNFKQLLDAAQQADGPSSYALMIKFIKQLDDSVVREGEVRTFGTFQGLYENFRNEFDKAKGKGFTGETRARIVNLAKKSAQALVEDYDAYKLNRSNNLYTPLGLDPELVFAGYEFNLDGIDFDKTYTAGDFESAPLPDPNDDDDFDFEEVEE